MKTKVVPFLFALVIVFLVGIYYASKKILVKDEKSITWAKIITPKNSETGESEAEKKSSSFETEKYETFVPLYTGETLISTLTIDINNDGYDDEVIVVRKSNSQNLSIVVAVMNPETGVYQRLPEIATEFTRTRTFSYTGMDVAGEHKTALIYQGLNDDGDYVMQIFHCNTNENGQSELVNIGDFRCDGTVFIQQTERSDSYSLSMSKGESFSVWVYKSETPEEIQTDSAKKTNVNQNQIQQEYKWNSATQKYELSREIRVTAGRLAAKELSRIQDGTVETFAAFLNGLWYKTSNTDSEIRYLYFNYEDKEIVQLFSDTQEVYEWEDSKLRHNGIYITAINADIMNLHRRFDITLVNLDEIKITLRDDINLVIKENTRWDGNYKKMSLQTSLEEMYDNNVESEFAVELKKGDKWSTPDALVSITFTDYNYTALTETLEEQGIYTLSKVGSYNIISFRSDFANSLFSEAYSISFGTKTITETVKRKTVEKVVTDYDTIMLTPVKFTSTDCFAAEGKSYTFLRESK